MNSLRKTLKPGVAGLAADVACHLRAGARGGGRQMEVADLTRVRRDHQPDDVHYLHRCQAREERDFYTAGGGVSGLQNGWAIAGDYLSAASFLGIAGLISLYGYDGFMYSVGWLVAYITVLLVIAEPCRNIGKYTLADILAYRNDPKKVRVFGAISTITVSTLYLTAQMVGGGVLVKTLIGIDYEISVITVGILMLGYVLFGGMVATTWVQLIKAVLLVAASTGRPMASRCRAT